MPRQWKVLLKDDPHLWQFAGRGNEFCNIWEHVDHLDQRYYELDSKCFEHISDANIDQAISVMHGLSIITNGALLLKTGSLGRFVDLDYSNVLFNDIAVSLNEYNWMPSMDPFEVILHRHISYHTIETSTAFDVIRASVKFEAVREVLFQAGMCFEMPPYYASYSAWTTLYGITDTIAYHMHQKFGFGKRDAVRELGVNYTEFNRFTGTANNFDYLGFYARHGRTTFVTPSNPMSIQDAYNVVFNLANNFIRYYVVNFNRSS